MKAELIYDKVSFLKKTYNTSKPNEILSHLNVVLVNKDYDKLKGYTLILNGITYVVINNQLNDSEKNIVMAHELAHVVLHQDDLALIPMIDNNIYNMTNKLEYEANIFAAELLIDDSEIIELTKSENSDFFTLCSQLNITPELMSFKLFSMIKKGSNYNLPIGMNSNFLK